MNAKLTRFTASAWFRAIWSKAIVCLVALMVLGACTVAMAKPPKKSDKPAEAEKSYVLGYAIVLLPIALGVMMVCRPGRRSDTAKRPAQDGE